MKKILLILVLAVICSSVVRANEIDDAAAAYDRGNYAQALVLFRVSATEEGSFAQAIGQYFIGRMFNNGEGVTQDYKEAAKWYRKAADQGDADAQNNLGMMYDNGQGILQDYILAHMWYNLSASNGGKNKNRDSMAKEMTPDQIAKAQEMVRACKKKKYKNCN